HGTRATSGAPPGCHYEPPARSWLTIRGKSRTKARPDVETRTPQVERREARRPASSAGDLRRSADRPVREAGHGVRRKIRTGACRRSAALSSKLLSYIMF